MGIYLESAIGASLGDGLLSTSVPIYNNTWPLYSVGEQLNVDDFAYPQDDKLGVTLSGSATYTFVPKSWLTMSIFDLKTGETDTQTYDPSRFDIQVDNPSFRYDRYTQKIEVVNKNNPVSEGNLVITWKGRRCPSRRAAPARNSAHLSRQEGRLYAAIASTEWQSDAGGHCRVQRGG